MTTLPPLIIALLFSVTCASQKISPCHYKKVDTVWQYKNAEIIIYKKNGNRAVDTIWYSKQKFGIRIEETDVLDIDDKKILNRK